MRSLLLHMDRLALCFSDVTNGVKWDTLGCDTLAVTHPQWRLAKVELSQQASGVSAVLPCGWTLYPFDYGGEHTAYLYPQASCACSHACVPEYTCAPACLCYILLAILRCGPFLLLSITPADHIGVACHSAHLCQPAPAF